MTTRTFVLVAGGGTAGHVLPGIAIANAIVERGHDRGAVHFAGAKRGMEGELVPDAGFDVTLLDVQGLKRSLSPRAIVHNARTLLTLLGAIVRAWRDLGALRPRAVVSVGGYASVPWVVSATLRRTPVVVVSYDAIPGLASRVTARFASVCAVAFASSPLRKKVVTGAPVRPEIAAIDRSTSAQERARHELGLPSGAFTVVVVGGSLGSGALNDTVKQLVAEHPDRADLAIHHVVGNRTWGEGWLASTGPDRLAYHPVPYEQRMDLAYAAADLVVARAGATTVAELAAAGVPSVLVPWPLATDDHQTANAKVLADVGGAVLLPEPQLSAERLLAEIDRLADDPAALDAMAVAARAEGRPDAAAAIARLVEEHAKP